jgi:hypothetical protein
MWTNVVLISGQTPRAAPRQIPAATSPARARIFQRNLNVAITTACNRKCPYCISSIPTRVPRHCTLEEIRRTGSLVFGRFRSVKLSGGEPTLHPRLEEIVSGGKAVFGCQILELESNGFDLDRLVPLANLLDCICLTIYCEDGVCSRDARHISAIARRFPPNKVKINTQVPGLAHSSWPTEIRPRKACQNIFTASAFDGRIYPCCVAPGIAGAEGASLELGWERKLPLLRPPCNRCMWGNG